MVESKSLSLTILIGTWLSVSIVFLAGEIIFRYGALAGILVVAALLTSFILLMPLLKYEPSLTPKLNSYRSVIFFIWLLEILILNMFIGTIVLEVGFHMSRLTSFLLHFIVMVSVLIGLNPSKKVLNFIIVVNITLIFVLAQFLPTYIYLQEGIETVYHNLLHYHPKVLHINQEHHLIYFVVAIFIFSSKFFLLLPLFRKYGGSDAWTGIRKLFVCILIIATMILAFSTMTIFAMTQNLTTEHLNELLLLLIKKQSSPFVFHLIIVMLYLLTILSTVISFREFEFITKLKLNTSRHKMIQVAILCFLFIFTAFIYKKGATILSIYFYLGSIIGMLSFFLVIIACIKLIKLKSNNI
ncbi:hypothetical protein JOC85_002482 [Bacillus mesophilus]|uniref:GerAB/ArcD/ProY family transporter n=1 Tax=Bacillus mesophilus TaxID=1808955 RepID=A0A6M0Q7L3_9BACI|nr:hypothetical protein [Bacillus mesophilus]MBM7661679.1 hypothetical protein [Bacillus mesophilus]NEY72341.1 hypothetical protein [Bacillus mesophilus]